MVIDDPAGFVTVGVDNSSSALAAARFAVAEAKMLNCHLVVAHAYRLPRHRTDIAGATVMRYAELGENTLNRVIAELQVPESVTIHTRLCQGSAAGMLRQAEQSSRMVVIGASPGNTPIYGTLISQLAAHASCPFLTVPKTWSPWAGGRRCPVLLAAAGNDVSAVTMDHAFAEAEARGAELVVLRVDEPNTSLVHRERGLAMLHDTVRSFRHQYPAVRTRIDTAIGDPKQVMIEATAGAALLVVGHARHGRSVPWRHSLPRAILSGSHCPVYLTPYETQLPIEQRRLAEAASVG